VPVTASDDPGGPRHARRWVVLAACTPLFVCSQFYRVANAFTRDAPVEGAAPEARQRPRRRPER
jgi:hypothetical protein